METRATPGVYTVERSWRVLTGIFGSMRILPPMCARKVLSATKTIRTPSMRLDRRANLLRDRLGGHGDRHVAGHRRAADPVHVDRPDDPAGIADR